MIIDIVTVFPEMIATPLSHSIIGRAAARGLVAINVIDLRDFTTDRHRTTDDYPFGGGGGMVMKPEPIFAAVESIQEQRGLNGRVMLLCPQGKVFGQATARELSRIDHLIMICGHYEGVDDRIRSIVTDEISIGDYVLTGGELGALVVTDAVVRLLPGVLGDEGGAERDSFGSSGLLEGPHYTRPRTFRGMDVPEVLLSGDHERIRRWRRKQSLLRTAGKRPDLLVTADLTGEDRKLLASDD